LVNRGLNLSYKTAGFGGNNKIADFKEKARSADLRGMRIVDVTRVTLLRFSFADCGLGLVVFLVDFDVNMTMF